jgi:hypothetical protein
MPAPNVKSNAAVGEKWARRAGSAGDEYSAGISGAGQRWASAAAAAENTWKTAVSEAAGRNAYGKGVAAAGPTKFEKNAREKGPMRFAQGVQGAQQDYQTGVGPYLDAIRAVDLPPRGPVGSQANYARVSAIGTALRKMKVGK